MKCVQARGCTENVITPLYPVHTVPYCLHELHTSAKYPLACLWFHVFCILEQVWPHMSSVTYEHA